MSLLVDELVIADDAPQGAACPVDVIEGTWWLVHTKPRQEKALARDLCAMDVAHYLPLARCRRQYGRRMVDVRMPLFPGYLFLCGAENDRYATLMTHRAANVIPVVDQLRLREDLRHVYTLTASDAPVDIYARIRKGRRCRVIRGMLRGLEGVVIRRRDACRVYVAVEMLGQSAEVELDPSLLEVID